MTFHLLWIYIFLPNIYRPTNRFWQYQSIEKSNIQHKNLLLTLIFLSGLYETTKYSNLCLFKSSQFNYTVLLYLNLRFIWCKRQLVRKLQRATITSHISPALRKGTRKGSLDLGSVLRGIRDQYSSASKHTLLFLVQDSGRHSISVWASNVRRSFIHTW